MTLEKDKVHIDWPLGIKYNVSYEYFDPPSWPTVSEPIFTPVNENSLMFKLLKFGAPF